MPIYEYRCNECGHQFEVSQRMSDEPITECEVCGGQVTKMLFAPAIHFKGTGFHNTDYGSKRRGAGDDGGSGSGDGAGSSNGSSTAPRAATKAAETPAEGGDSAIVRRQDGGAGQGLSAVARGIPRKPARRVLLHPARVIVVGFAAAIVIGTALLTIGAATEAAGRAPFATALFTRSRRSP